MYIVHNVNMHKHGFAEQTNQRMNFLRVDKLKELNEWMNEWEKSRTTTSSEEEWKNTAATTKIAAVIKSTAAAAVTVVAAAAAWNQNINNLLICKYRMIMPTQTRGNFQIIYCFSFNEVWFYWFFRCVHQQQPAFHNMNAAAAAAAQALLCLLYFRLPGKSKYLFNMLFRTRDNQKRRSKWAERARVCVCVCEHWAYCVFSQTAFDDIHLDA